MNNFNQLFTARAQEIGETPWDIYPRPSLKRDSFVCLNGDWDFAVTKGEQPEKYTDKIRVPYPIESNLSNICKTYTDSDVFYYKKEFSFHKEKDTVILHFGAVYQTCEVFLNSEKLGENNDGYNPFSFDISDKIKEQNTLLVRVKNVLGDFVYPYGKSVRKRGGMWYTPITGIWQTVWLEQLPKKHIKKIKIAPKTTGADIIFSGIENGYIECEGKRFQIVDSKAEVFIENPCFWSPEAPNLYYFTAYSDEDKIESYFAIRTLEIKEIDQLPRLCLNGTPYFFNGVLDQGYWPDGLFTPASPEAFSDDIIAMKNLGFNMLRKHIKVEPELFYYYCDKLGMVVFQDMVNNGDYSFMRDTVLPTFFTIKKNDRNIHKNEKTRTAFINGMQNTVKNLYNHPSICLWTIFNEGWGQFCADDMYNLLKSIDATRFIDSASGWFLPKNSDLLSRHIYFKKLKNFTNGKPYYISEFGGYSFRIDGHIFNTSKTYGYGKFNNQASYENALCSLFENEVLPLVKKGLCATVYTQVSDVEDETNGLLTYDRLPKLKTKKLFEICEKIKKQI